MLQELETRNLMLELYVVKFLGHLAPVAPKILAFEKCWVGPVHEPSRLVSTSM